MEIALESLPDGRGRYVAHLPDGLEAQLIFRRLGGGLILVEHTGVPDALKGQGVGGALVARLVGDARALGHKIVSRCGFVDAAFARNPDWSPVRAGG